MLKLNPNRHDALAKLVHFTHYVCDWSRRKSDGAPPPLTFITTIQFHYYAYQVSALLALARSQIARGEATSVVPFNAITLPFTLAEILQIARLHSEKTCKDVERVTLTPSQLAVSSAPPLRVGYLSADFRHIHPVGRDLAAILPQHTRRF